MANKRQPPEEPPPFVDAELVDDEPRRPAANQATAVAVRQNDTMAAVDVAKKYPRDVSKFLPEITAMACVDEEVAEGCSYTLRRRDRKSGQVKLIEGASIRMAEFAIAAWGNIRTAGRIVGESPDGQFIIAQGMAWDIEKNVSAEQEVRRRIVGANGRKYGVDMIQMTGAAAISLAIRNAVFRVVPMALIKPALDAAQDKALGDPKKLPERRVKVFERLKKTFNLTEERILGSIGRESIEEVSLLDVRNLIGLGVAVREGEQELDDAFPKGATTEKGKLENFLGEDGEKAGAGEREPGGDDQP